MSVYIYKYIYISTTLIWYLPLQETISPIPGHFINLELLNFRNTLYYVTRLIICAEACSDPQFFACR